MSEEYKHRRIQKAMFMGEEVRFVAGNDPYLVR